MKRYIFTLFILVAILSSCSNNNNEATASYTTNFKINPATVIKPFTYEIQAGQLESFDSDFKLRVRLLIYNDKGNLVDQEVQFLTNYDAIMSCAKQLPKGNYTAIATSDVVKESNDKVTFQYWSLQDSTTLATSEINKTGYIGRIYGILGVSKNAFSVGNSNNDVSISIKPAGALLCMYFANIHTYSNVVSYGILETKYPKSLIFDGNGDYIINCDNNNGAYDWWLNEFDIADYNSSITNLYGYSFTLPTSNLKIKFEAVINDQQNSKVDLSDGIILNPAAGEEYGLYINFAKKDSDYNISYSIINGSSSTSRSVNHNIARTNSASKMISSNNKLMLKDVK
jgi:hypothetical protein